MKRKSKYCDPDPRRRSRRGHRKGVEPAGLKRWRLAHKTHDPGRRSSLWQGRRGGHYFQGPHKRRYGPARRRRRFSGARRAGGKAEGLLNRWGTAIGAALGLGIGVYQGYNDYSKAYGKSAAQNYLHTIIGGDIMAADGTTKLDTRTPEISKLWGTHDTLWSEPRGPLDYLKFKFLGQDLAGSFKGSAWVYPFWIGLAAALAAPIARLFTSKGQRFLKPLHKLGVGMLGVSTVGALALPGSPKKSDAVNGAFPPVPPNQFNNQIKGAF